MNLAFFNLQKSHKGFTLVEVLVGVVIISGLAVSLSKIFQVQTMAQKKLAQNFTVLQRAEEVSYVLNDSVSCLRNLHGKKNGYSWTVETNEEDRRVSFYSRREDAPPLEPDGSNFKEGFNEEFEVAALEKVYGKNSQGGVELIEIRLVNIDEDGSRIAAGVNPEPNYIELKFDKKAKSYGGESLAYKIPIAVNMTDGVISSCMVEEDSLLKNICENLLKGYFKDEDKSCRSISFQSAYENDPGDPSNHDDLPEFGVNIRGRVLIRGDLELGDRAQGSHHVLFKASDQSLEATKKISVGQIEIESNCENLSNLDDCHPQITGVNTIVADSIIVKDEIKAKGIWYTSDLKFKKNVKKISPAFLERVLSLQGTSYQWKDSKSNQKQFGFIAQDVEKILPEIVRKSKQNGSRSISYNSLISPLLEIVKRQTNDIKILEEKLESISTK